MEVHDKYVMEKIRDQLNELLLKFKNSEGKIQKQTSSNCAISEVMPSAYEKITDEELKKAELKKLNEFRELNKEITKIIDEQFYRTYPECRPH